MSFIKKGGKKTTKTLPEQNYQRIIQNSGNISTKLANIVEDTTPQLGGDLDLNGHNIDFPTTANISDCLDEDDMSSDSATVLATQQSIKAYADTNLNYITPISFEGNGGFAKTSVWWRVQHLDNNAYIDASFVCPQTRDDWQILIISFSTGGGALTDSGALYVGAAGSGETYSQTNIFNATNFDIAFTNNNVLVYDYSSTFSATKGDYIWMRWKKDDNGGGSAAYIYITAIVLYHA